MQSFTVPQGIAGRGADSFRMMVAEVVQTLLELDQKSEIVFTKRNDSEFIYVIASLPSGQKVAAEMPTAIPKENTIERSNSSQQS